MAVIAENAGLTTLVVVFPVEPAEQEEMVAYLVGTAHAHSRHDGFVSCSIHRSTDGLRVVEYIQWRSLAHVRAMAATPEGQAHLHGRARQGEMHVYEVSAVVEVGVPLPA